MTQWCPQTGQIANLGRIRIKCQATKVTAVRIAHDMVVSIHETPTNKFVDSCSISAVTSGSEYAHDIVVLGGVRSSHPVDEFLEPGDFRECSTSEIYRNG